MGHSNWLHRLTVIFTCFHVPTLLGNPLGNPGMIISFLVCCKCMCRRVWLVYTQLWWQHSVITYPMYLLSLTENQLLMISLLFFAADHWAWAVCHRCHQCRPAAARCIVLTLMTCMLTWPVRCPLPAPVHPHQTIPARSEGQHEIGLNMAETRTEVSVGIKVDMSQAHRTRRLADAQRHCCQIIKPQICQYSIL